MTATRAPERTEELRLELRQVNGNRGHRTRQELRQDCVRRRGDDVALAIGATATASVQLDVQSLRQTLQQTLRRSPAGPRRPVARGLPMLDFVDAQPSVYPEDSQTVAAGTVPLPV